MTTNYPILFNSNVMPQGTLWMGIDPSLTNFAVSVIDESDRYACYVLSPKIRGAARLKLLSMATAELVSAWHPKDVAMEGTVLRSTSASVLGELSGVIKLALYDEGVFPLVVPPLTLKKFVVGKASGVGKNQMLLSVYKRYGAEITDDNAADAYGLARIARGKGITKVEEEVLTKLAQPKFREQ